MRTHLRARTNRAGALLALVIGMVAGFPTAALAAPPGVSIDSVSARNVASGSNVTIRYTVSNQGGGGGETDNGNARIDIAVTGMGCSGECTPSQQIRGSEDFEATLTAPTVAAGQTKTVTVTVTATLAGEQPGVATADITVAGPAAPTTVRQVSGRIKDDDGARVAGVQVIMVDSQQHSYTATTDSGGGYSFNSSDAKPIAAGSIKVAAAKNGYEATEISVQGTAGRTVNVPLTLKKVAAASTSPTPSASTKTSAPAAAETTDEAPAEDAPPIAADPGGLDNTASTADEGGSSWLLIVMGVLLVAAGLGAMVLVWLRRKNAEKLSSDTGIGQAVPAGAGGFDATRVAAPVGAGRSDATMVAPAGMGGMGAGLGGGLSDAPTMIHRPAVPAVEDEFPDPYGVPLPPGGGFHGGNQWDDQQGSAGYGAAQQPYGQQGGAYGAAQGGYPDAGQPQRYDEHTNLYQPQQPQRYDEHTNLYQPEQGGGYGAAGYDQAGYDQQQAGYDQGWNGQEAAGYNAQAGYDPQAGYAAGYEQPQQGAAYGGYEQQAGYPQQAGNYAPGYEQTGYDQQPQQPGGYPDQRGGPYGNNGQRPNREWDND